MLNRVISKRQPRTIQDTRLFLAPGDHSIRNDLANESAVKGCEEEATIRPSCDTSCPVGPELQVRLVLGQGSTAKQGATTAQEGDRPRPAFLGEGGHGGLASWCAAGAKPLERYCHHNGAR